MKDFIKINNLILFSNKGEGNLIDIPNLQFDSKSISVIIGPNGAGKSLLLNIIQGLILPSAGTIKIKSSIKDKSCKKSFYNDAKGLSFLRRTTEQNIQFVLELNKDKIKVSYLDVLERFDLIAQRKILANKLSGGEKQRLALALAIITNSKILLLDEPTANADPRTTIKIEKIIKEEAIAGKKILLVTHNIPQAKRLGQDIAFIHRGKVLEHCDKAVFVNHPKVKEINQFLEGSRYLNIL